MADFYSQSQVQAEGGPRSGPPGYRTGESKTEEDQGGEACGTPEATTILRDRRTPEVLVFDLSYSTSGLDAPRSGTILCPGERPDVRPTLLPIASHLTQVLQVTSAVRLVRPPARPLRKTA